MAVDVDERSGRATSGFNDKMVLEEGDPQIGGEVSSRRGFAISSHFIMP